jgi:hypothetical protein
MFDATSAIGSPFVVTSNNGGHSPEQVAELCVNRLIQVSDTAPPELAQQARAFRQEMLAVVLHYVRMAAAEDRTTVCTKLEQSGMADLAKHVRSL